MEHRGAPVGSPDQFLSAGTHNGTLERLILVASNMNSRFFAFAAILYAGTLPCSVAQRLPGAQANAPDSQSAEAVRAALLPWIRASEHLLSKTNDLEVRSYVQVLRNAALMAPSGEGGPAALAQRVLAPPPDTSRPWVGVIVIDLRKDLPPGRWQQFVAQTDFVAEYHDDTNTIYLRSDIPQIPIIRGLLIIHEMRHWWQRAHPEASKEPEPRLRKEVDAYQAEFRILDAIRLPKYQELLTAERSRIRNLLTGPRPQPIQPDVNNPLLEQTFGSFPNPIAKQMVAAEIAVRAAFGELETLPPTLAQQRKIDLLRSLGY